MTGTQRTPHPSFRGVIRHPTREERRSPARSRVVHDGAIEVADRSDGARSASNTGEASRRSQRALGQEPARWIEDELRDLRLDASSRAAIPSDG